jgi:hypothetical protein
MSEIQPTTTREELARELLRYKMMEYSGDFFCATWLVDLEFDLWTEAIRENPTPQQEYTVSLSRELRVLAEIAGGWWVYEDETCPGERGPIFIPMKRWLRVLDNRT